MLIAIALGSLAAGLSVARGLTRDALEPASTLEPHAFPGLQTQLTPAVTPEPTLDEPTPSAQPSAPEPESATTASTPTVTERSPEPIAPSAPAPNVASEVPAQFAPPAPVEPTSPTPIATPATPEPAPPARATTTAPQDVARKREANVPPAAATNTPAASATPPALSSGATPQVELGIVAYTKCDGVPQLDKRFPCPRDLRLEARVRRAINALDRCALKPEQRGQGSVRLEFERELPVKVSVEAPRRGGFDRAAVSHCTGRSLADVRTSLKPDQMVVLFYFGLR
jgi:hypothetical protein